MKRLPFALLLLLACPIGMLADTVTSLVVLTKDGTTTTIELAEKPTVTFEGTDLKIHSTQTDAAIPLADVVRYTFVTRDASGITEVTGPQPGIDYRDGVLVITHAKGQAPIHIYTPDGKLIKTLTPPRDGTYRLPLSSLPTGVYLVKTNQLTCKVLKR